MESIQIRPAEPRDAVQVLALMKQVGAESDNLTFGAEGLPFQAKEEAAFLANLQKDPRSVFLGAWRDSDLIATASLTALSRRMAHQGEIAISVAKAAWGQGVGSRLMEALIHHARSAGLEILSLKMRTDNTRALRLYTKFGFRTIGIFPDFFKIGEQYADIQIMYLDLR